MRKAVYIFLISILLSACANNAPSETVETPAVSQTTVQVQTTPIGSTTSSAKEEKSVETSTTTVAMTSSLTTKSISSVSRTKDNSVDKYATETETVTSQTEVTLPDKTEPNVTTSVSVSERKPKVTTASSAPKITVTQGTTTTKPKQSSTATTEKPKATTTTATTSAPSRIEWSNSMKVWKKLSEGQKLTGSEQDIIRDEILDYALQTFNGKKDIHVSFGIDAYDISYEKPLDLTINREMTSMANAHMDAYVDANRKGLIDYASSEQEIYDIVADTRQSCLHVIDYGLYNRWEILSINGSLKYASDIEFNVGFDEDMALWFLTQD